MNLYSAGTSNKRARTPKVNLFVFVVLGNTSRDFVIDFW